MSSACEHTRVIKKILANQPGAIKLARRFGQALVCVRYRNNENGSVRYTTVELLVDQAPVRKRTRDADIVALKLVIGEVELRQRIQASGGQWDARALVWRLPRGAVKRLGLLDRVVAGGQQLGTKRGPPGTGSS